MNSDQAHSYSVVPLPAGFFAHVANIGVKDSTDDFVVVASETPCSSAAVFTRSRFSGPSVTLSRRHAATGQLRAAIVISKNANVATGDEGEANAAEVASGVADALGIPSEHIVLSSTGVIGRQYPMDNIRSGLANLSWPFSGTDAMAVARGMMTTDTHPKVATATAGTARIVGVAKGVGMIEPDMATMLTFLFTDAAVKQEELAGTFRHAIDRTFNSLSVDTDTSTSDTAAILANGAAGTVGAAEFARAVEAVCLDLTRQLARDGEGATKLLIVRVDAARDDEQAKRVAKAILNSPLVKTAVHGADPNWGRVAMAVGKCSDDTDIEERNVVIRFGPQEVYPASVDAAGLHVLSQYMKGDEVLIHVSLGIANGDWTVYGCDLSDQYIRINADYTT